MNSMNSNIERALLEALPKGTRLLVAVSGGIDSVCLLHACVATAAQSGCHFEVAHVNHNLRPESSADAAFVRDLSKKYGFPYHELEAERTDSKENSEHWGRKIRYRFFRDVLSSEGLDHVLTAHTASDAAETLLMKLLSNKELTSIAESNEGLRCIRPFLRVSKSEVESYRESNNLTFVHDSTNEDLQFLRNKVRRLLLPMLEANFGPGIESRLAGRARELQDDYSLLQAVAEAMGSAFRPDEFGSRDWKRKLKSMLTQADAALRWRVIAYIFQPKLGYILGRTHARRVSEVILNQRGGTELPGGFALKAKNGGVILEQAKRL